MRCTCSIGLSVCSVYSSMLKVAFFFPLADERPLELLVEACAINSFDIDPQNPSVSHLVK